MNNETANTKWSKTQLSKMVQSGRFLGRLLGPLMRVGLPFLKNVLTALAKGVLIPLEQWQQMQLFKKNYTNNLKRRNEKYHENS